jgi:hypothetical protein
MARHYAILLLGVLVLASCSKLLPPATTFDEFKAAIYHAAADRKASYGNQVFHPDNDTVEIDMEMNRLKSTLDQSFFSESELHVQRLSDQFSDVKAVQDAGENLILDIHEREQAELDSLTTAIKAMQKDELNALLTAEKETDLDPLFIKIGELQRRVTLAASYASGDNAQIFQQFFQSVRYLNFWKNYLSLRAFGKMGETQHVYNRLKTIKNMGFDLPSAQIIERLETLNRSIPASSAMPVPGTMPSTIPEPAPAK